jgi:mannose-6-phosphate isomerase class I
MFKFRPILKSTLWGGEKIVPFKHLQSTQTNVGESWEISDVEGDESIVASGPDAGKNLSELVKEYQGDLVGDANYAHFGNRFPLLIKFIDACDDLSIQVHPNDALAMQRHNSMGKTEMWYVIDNAGGKAHLRSGLKTKLTPEQYAAKVADHTICDALAEYAVQPGDVFFLPASTASVPDASSPRSSRPATSLTASTTSTAATRTAMPANSTPNSRRPPSTTRWRRITARPIPPPSTSRWNWCPARTSPPRSTT